MHSRLTLLAGVVLVVASTRGAWGQAASVSGGGPSKTSGDSLDVGTGPAAHRTVPSVFAELRKEGGRYQMNAAGDRLLDTATGTLYTLDGESWLPRARLSSADRTENEAALRGQIRLLQTQVAGLRSRMHAPPFQVPSGGHDLSRAKAAIGGLGPTDIGRIRGALEDLRQEIGR